DTVRCVSGRTWNQIPSHANGSQSPLPFGTYTFDIPGSVEYLGGEFGGVWSGITPTFPTARNALGVHFDPSAFAYDENTGTSGCLATVTAAERDIMTNFIMKYQPTHLVVKET
ncbi:MAG: SH3 domain-containing protein, partial [Microcoleaceae cyanobacterium]